MKVVLLVGLGNFDMTIERTFKNLIILNSLIVISLAFGSIFFETPEVNKILENISDGLLFKIGYEKIIGILLLIYFLIYLVSLLFLYRFIYFGKPLFTIYFICNILISLSSGTLVESALFATLGWLDGATEGAILVFLYFTPIKEKFVKHTFY